MTLDWVCACDAPVACEPVRVSESAVVFGSMDAVVHAIRLQDGVRIWETRLPRLSIASLTVLDDGAILAAVGVKARGRGTLTTLNPQNGDVTWTWNAPGTISGAVAVSGTRLICGTFFRRAGEVTCIERGARRPAWRTSFDGWVTGALVHGDCVYAPCMDDRMHCLDLATGERRWSFAARGLVCALPLVHQDTLYFGAHDGLFYAIDLHGRLIWRTELADRVTGSAAVWDRAIIFGGWDGRVRGTRARRRVRPGCVVARCWRANRGHTAGAEWTCLHRHRRRSAVESRCGGRPSLSTFPPGQPLTREIKTRPLVADGRLLVGSYDGGAYALRLESM